jgi:hypothetical protein
MPLTKDAQKSEAPRLGRPRKPPTATGDIQDKEGLTDEQKVDKIRAQARERQRRSRERRKQEAASGTTSQAPRKKTKKHTANGQANGVAMGNPSAVPNGATPFVQNLGIGNAVLPPHVMAASMGMPGMSFPMPFPGMSPLAMPNRATPFPQMFGPPFGMEGGVLPTQAPVTMGLTMPPSAVTNSTRTIVENAKLEAKRRLLGEAKQSLAALVPVRNRPFDLTNGAAPTAPSLAEMGTVPVAETAAGDSRPENTRLAALAVMSCHAEAKFVEMKSQLGVQYGCLLERFERDSCNSQDKYQQSQADISAKSEEDLAEAKRNLEKVTAYNSQVFQKETDTLAQRMLYWKMQYQAEEQNITREMYRVVGQKN